MGGNVDSLIDNFEELLLEMAALEMATPRMEYAVAAQFVDRLEESGKINATEKLRLKDILEEPDCKPKRGDTTELMKRELKRLRVAENREEPFLNKDTVTNYVKSDSRSRYDSWRGPNNSSGFMRSESRPGYYRTASRGNYIRDSSKFRGRSASRPNGNARPYRNGSRIRSLSQGKTPQSSTEKRDKSADEPKSEFVKKVEGMEKKIISIEKSLAGVSRIEESCLVTGFESGSCHDMVLHYHLVWKHFFLTKW